MVPCIDGPTCELGLYQLFVAIHDGNWVGGSIVHIKLRIP